MKNSHVNGVDEMRLLEWLFNKKHSKDLEAQKIHKENIEKIIDATQTLKKVEESRSSNHDSIAEKIYKAMGGGDKR